MSGIPQIETLEFDSFRRLQGPWDELVAGSHVPFPFLSHAWIEGWWRHFGDGQRFALIVVRDAQSWVAAVPLALRSARFLGKRVTIAEIVGTGPVPGRGMGLSDKADLIVRTAAPEALAALGQALVERLEGVDLFDLRGFDSHSATASMLVGAVRGRVLLERSVSPYLPLPATWDDYLRSRSGNFRKHLRKYRRELEERGAVQIVRAGSATEAGELFDEACRISTRSWTGRRGTDLFRRSEIRAFFRELVQSLVEQRRVDLRLLRVADEGVAYEICFDEAGRIWSYNGGYDSAWARQSPGTVLTADVIESACAAGRTEYDMLRGDEGYKLRWSELARAESELLLPAFRWAAQGHALLGVRLKERLRRWPWLVEVDDKLSGALGRLRQRHPSGS